MYRLAPLLLLAVAVTACGGRTTAAQPPAAKAQPDPAHALRALARAAARGDDKAVARFLAPRSQASASELGEGLGTFAGVEPHTLYRGGAWAVVAIAGERTAEGTRERAAYAAALRLVRGRWRVDLSERVRLRILGPQPGARAPRVAQVGVALDSPTDLVESALWIDGHELLEKGGGSATRASIYGVPAKPLRPGLHVAVAYARTAASGSALAWVFRV